jgi:DNA-binding response OmpR family regulator
VAKVLSIDDSRAVHAYLRDCFARSNVELGHAYSAQQGFDLLLAAHAASESELKYDLVFLDWEMPGMSGLEVLVKIREAGIGVPVIMVTSKNSTQDIAEVLAKGAQEYVMKPFTEDILFSKIEDVIGLKVVRDVAH